MSWLGLFILSTAIGNSGGTKGQDAAKALMKVAYKESNIETQLKRIQNKYLDKKYQKFGGYVITIGKITQEQKITYEWTF